MPSSKVLVITTAPWNSPLQASKGFGNVPWNVSVVSSASRRATRNTPSGSHWPKKVTSPPPSASWTFLWEGVISKSISSVEPSGFMRTHLQTPVAAFIMSRMPSPPPPNIAPTSVSARPPSMVSCVCLRALRFCVGACVGSGAWGGARRTVSGVPAVFELQRSTQALSWRALRAGRSARCEGAAADAGVYVRS